MIPDSVLQWRAECEKWVAIYHNVLDWREAMAILWSESTGNPLATNPGDPSWGLGQLTGLIARHYLGIATVPARSTDPELQKKWPSYGYDTSHVLYKPQVSVHGLVAYLSDLKQKHSASFPLTDLNCGWPVAYNEGEPNEIKHIPDPKYMAAFLSHLKDLQTVI